MVAPEKEDPEPVDMSIPIAEVLDGAIVITKNPNGMAPLAAEAVFRTKDLAQISIEVLGDEPLRQQFKGFATEHSIPILGLYPGVENQVKLTITDPDHFYAVETITISTPPLPDFYPNIDIVKVDTARTNSFLPSSAM
jgi:arylsulfate sulfotransferase